MYEFGLSFNFIVLFFYPRESVNNFFDINCRCMYIVLCSIQFNHLTVFLSLQNVNNYSVLFMLKSRAIIQK